MMLDNVKTTQGSVVTKVGVGMKVGKIMTENGEIKIQIRRTGGRISLCLPMSAKNPRIRKEGI